MDAATKVRMTSWEIIIVYPVCKNQKNKMDAAIPIAWVVIPRKEKCQGGHGSALVS